VTADPLEPAPRYPGRVLDARLHLLDRQVLDRDGVPVTTVDDLELEGPPSLANTRIGPQPPRLVALLNGSVLATRIFGGRPPSSRLQRIPLESVDRIETVLSLSTAAEEEVATWTERWLRDRVIRHIPGGSHDPE
jgi:hypothetical protein